MLEQRRTFLSVFGHRPIKISKDWLANPREDLCPIRIHLWWSCVPLILWCFRQACHSFPTKINFTPQVSTEQTCWHEHPDCRGTMLWLSKRPCIAHGQRAFIMLCGLYIWAESNFIIRNTSVAAVPGRTDDWWCEPKLFMFCSQPRILFSASLVSYCFCIIRTLCPIKMWSPGHFLL